MQTKPFLKIWLLSANFEKFTSKPAFRGLDGERPFDIGEFCSIRPPLYYFPFLIFFLWVGIVGLGSSD